MRPTARTLQRVRDMGGIAGVVERYNQFSRKRHDLFGCIDVVAIIARQTYGIQTTSGSNHATHVRAALENRDLRLWLQAGNHFEVWSWSQRVAYNKDGSKAKVKRWTLRRDCFQRHNNGQNRVWVTRKDNGE